MSENWRRWRDGGGEGEKQINVFFCFFFLSKSRERADKPQALWWWIIKYTYTLSDMSDRSLDQKPGRHQNIDGSGSLVSSENHLGFVSRGATFG